MPRPHLNLLATIALLPALAAAATPEHVVPAVTCVPADAATLQNGAKPIDTGAITRYGRTTPPQAFFCPIQNTDPMQAQASWGTMDMVVLDNAGSGGNVLLRLFAKSRGRAPSDPPLGTTFVVAQMRSVLGTQLTRQSAPLPTALDFHRFTYWWVVELRAPATGTLQQMEVHELVLRP